MVDGQKMAKSLGNFYTLRDVIEKGYSGREARYALMRVHYRAPLNFTWEGMEEARVALNRIDADPDYGKDGRIRDGASPHVHREHSDLFWAVRGGGGVGAGAAEALTGAGFDAYALRTSDAVTMNRDRLIADAKRRVLDLAPDYVTPTPRTIRALGGIGIGVMSFTDKSGGEQFTLRDLEALDSIAPQIAVVLGAFAAYELAQCPGREREAYAQLHALYHSGESERVPTLLRRLRELEIKLDIPADQRIPDLLP